MYVCAWEYKCICVGVFVCVCLALTGRRQSMPDYVVVAVVLDVVAAANCAAHVAYANVQIAHIYSRYIYVIYVAVYLPHVDRCLCPHLYICASFCLGLRGV